MSADEAGQMMSRHQLRVLSLRYLASTAQFLNVCQKQIRSRTLDDTEFMAGGAELVAAAKSLSEG